MVRAAVQWFLYGGCTPGMKEGRQASTHDEDSTRALYLIRFGLIRPAVLE